MILAGEICALVPMRHNSQRVPGKNYRLLGGHPLYRHVVDSLLYSQRIARIVVDTDSPVIIEDVQRSYGEQVKLIVRPSHLTAPTIAMNEILKYDIEQTGTDLYLQTHSTNPLLKPQTIANAVDRFRESLAKGTHDSLFSVTRRHVRIWSEAGQPMNHDPQVLLRTQDLPPFFEENSCLYLFTAESFRRNNNRIGVSPMMYEIDPLEAVDIDEEEDFLLAETLFEKMRKRTSN